MDTDAVACPACGSLPRFSVTIPATGRAVFGMACECGMRFQAPTINGLLGEMQSWSIGSVYLWKQLELAPSAVPDRAKVELRNGDPKSAAEHPQVPRLAAVARDLARRACGRRVVVD